MGTNILIQSTFTLFSIILAYVAGILISKNVKYEQKEIKKYTNKTIAVITAILILTLLIKTIYIAIIIAIITLIITNKFPQIPLYLIGPTILIAHIIKTNITQIIAPILLLTILISIQNNYLKNKNYKMHLAIATVIMILCLITLNIFYVF
ncbi:hypothetical protein K9L97_01865 [Candidatus Woesearchaeota archaeon]|nr:hypothetical protein [Candidatus Woesearchaeota archaeon]